MIGNYLSINRLTVGRRVGSSLEPPDVGPIVAGGRAGAGSATRARPVEDFADPAEAAVAELGGGVDLLLSGRMNRILTSPAIASMTHRANVLHSVVSWLEAQSSRLGGAQEAGGAHADPLPWLGSVVGVLNEEIELIKIIHTGAVRDVEGKFE